MPYRDPERARQCRNAWKRAHHVEAMATDRERRIRQMQADDWRWHCVECGRAISWGAQRCAEHRPSAPRRSYAPRHPKQCLWCGTAFMARRADQQLYCKRACQRRAYKMRHPDAGREYAASRVLIAGERVNARLLPAELREVVLLIRQARMILNPTHRRYHHDRHAQGPDNAGRLPADPQ